MTIRISKIDFVQKTERGHLITTPILSQHIAQLERDAMQVLYREGYIAQASSGKRNLIIKNIRDMKTGVRAPSRVYSKLKSWFASYLEARNMRATITGSG